MKWRKCPFCTKYEMSNVYVLCCCIRKYEVYIFCTKEDIIMMWVVLLVSNWNYDLGDDIISRTDWKFEQKKKRFRKITRTAVRFPGWSGGFKTVLFSMYYYMLHTPVSTIIRILGPKRLLYFFWIIYLIWKETACFARLKIASLFFERDGQTHTYILLGPFLYSVFEAPKSVLGTLPSAQNPFPQNPLVPILGKVFILFCVLYSFFAILEVNFGNNFWTFELLLTIWSNYAS